MKGAVSPERVDPDGWDVEGGAPPLQLRQLSDAGYDATASQKGSTRIQELSFLDLCYSIDAPTMGKQRVPRKDGERRRSSLFSRSRNGDAGGKAGEKAKMNILDHVSGEARSGEMLALMGPSGSGKTSLLNVLAQRVPSKNVHGGTYVDGKPLTKAFKRQMGFVFQDDLMLWNLTVRETMLFAAKLRLPQSIPLSEKEECVDDLIEKLGLTDCAHSIIGKESRRGVSGGERKRASIGVELVTAPAVLFLDEPTSGLDSSTALSIVTLLHQLARGGVIVVCSIHQPRANIFNQFDKVLLLVKGRIAYYGRQRDMVPYFSGLGLELPPATNAADWVLDLTAGTSGNNLLPNGMTITDAYAHGGLMDLTAGTSGNKLLPNGMTITDVYAHSVAGLDDGALKARGVPTADSIKVAETEFKDKKLSTSWVTTFWYQLRVLLERQGKQSRGEVFSGVNIFQILAVAVIASAVWFQSNNISDITGVFFFISIQQSFNALSSIMRVFPAERGLMMRERSTGSYRVGPYFLAKSFSDMALYVLFPAIYATLVYWCVGLRPSASAFVVYLVIFLSEIMAAQSVGMLISAAIKDFAAAQSFSFVLVLVIMLFGGFYVNNDRIPQGIRWIKYLSFLYWGYGALLVNEFEGRSFACNAEDEARYGGGDCPISGDDVLAVYDFQHIKVWQSLLVLWAMFLALRFMTYCVLRKTTKMHS
ncbi:ATP-binding cassette superfamily [Tribonema minus]|uniref:ATP-binding cassette superfamily n=1 Tax=Tribonema minus TaxID=303371 RepID=A0A835YP26_9STRA|nr:ATP-binding cassette superfamily [Tribonema minus]